jgi:hypothetical protein
MTQLQADYLYDPNDFCKPLFNNLDFCSTDNDKKSLKHHAYHEHG